MAWMVKEHLQNENSSLAVKSFKKISWGVTLKLKSEEEKSNSFFIKCVYKILQCIILGGNTLIFVGVAKKYQF